jgi:hypothetical protein
MLNERKEEKKGTIIFDLDGTLIMHLPFFTGPLRKVKANGKSVEPDKTYYGRYNSYHGAVSPKLRETLQELEKNYQLILLSDSTNSHVVNALTKLGIPGVFDHILSREWFENEVRQHEKDMGNPYHIGRSYNPKQLAIMKMFKELNLSKNGVVSVGDGLEETTGALALREEKGEEFNVRGAVRIETPTYIGDDGGLKLSYIVDMAKLATSFFTGKLPKGKFMRKVEAYTAYGPEEFRKDEKTTVKDIVEKCNAGGKGIDPEKLRGLMFTLEPRNIGGKGVIKYLQHMKKKGLLPRPGSRKHRAAVKKTRRALWPTVEPRNKTKTPSNKTKTYPKRPK